jgi:type II secretory pathway component GspD/PulD (secretin)
MYHKTADEFIRFVKDNFPEWIEKGNVAKVEAKGRSIVILGDTPDPNDPTAKKIAQVIDSFDDLELKVESRIVRPRYVDARLVMDTLAMRGLANIWRLTEETSTATWTEGKNTMSAVTKRPAFAQTSLVGTGAAPVPVPPKVPYVYEVPSKDPFEVPKVYSGNALTDQVLVSFNNMSSTEQRGGIVAVGTQEDLERIQAFIDSIDVPARQIMIEVQVIELEANKLIDIGFDSFQLGQNHTLGTGAFPLPGENIIQPGLTSVGRDGPPHIVPPVTQQGLGLIFDDTALDLTGRFMTTLHALVREGDATVKARPKILTLDDRVSVLHIGQEVPIFKSTGVTHDTVNGNLVSEVNQVGTQYVGFTLNMRPRVSGGAEDEVSLQIEVIVNELGERQRVFAEDLLGIPTVTKRQYVGQNRVKNHRPIILGGLIQEQQVESVNKIPLLADVPLLGYLFRRTQKTQSRMEVILVLTPHILSEKGVDRIATPKESAHFDTFDSVLFNDRHIIKGKDVIGIDPITGNPAQADGKIFTEEEVIDLTLLNIVRERQLVSKLKIIDDYLGDAAKQLNWIQRRFPEATVRNWSPQDQEIYFRAAAIVIENIKELNTDLKYEEIITPRREIVLPTTPYRISLTYDRVKSLQVLASPLIFRGERVELTEQTVALMREASGRGLREFADFLEARKRKAEEHAELLPELKRFYSGQNPTKNALEGIPYPDVYRELAAAKFDFVSLATYFQENLADRYRNVGSPNVGAFEGDLKAFVETSISLHQRAKKLMELDTKWTKLNTDAEETTEADAGKP